MDIKCGFKGWAPAVLCPEDSPIPLCLLREEPGLWLKPVENTLFINDYIIRENECINFVCLTIFEAVKLRWNGPSSYTVYGSVHPRATCFCVDVETDYVMESLDELVTEVIEYLEPMPGNVMGVLCYDISNTAFELRDGVLVETDS